LRFFSSGQLTAVGLVLLVIEVFHAYAHANVLLRVQPPTLEQLKARRYYFVFDMLTPLMSYCLHESWGLFVLIHALAHTYYVYDITPTPSLRASMLWASSLRRLISH
jgi:hypothetical protein